MIDHAWGWEPCTVEAVKAYKPSERSLCSGQVLHEPYTAAKAGLVLQEMADALALDLVDKNLQTDQLVLTVGYDIDNLRTSSYRGVVTVDHYGRAVPQHAHGTINLAGYTASARLIIKSACELYGRITDNALWVRRLTLVANHVLPAQSVLQCAQQDLFSDTQEVERAKMQREHSLQLAELRIKKRFGKNAILKGMNFLEGATARDRNGQIGGHKA